MDESDPRLARIVAHLRSLEPDVQPADLFDAWLERTARSVLEKADAADSRRHRILIVRSILIGTESDWIRGIRPTEAWVNAQAARIVDALDGFNESNGHP